MGLSIPARRRVAAGALLMLLAIALGAFGAHALAARLEPRSLEIFRTGVDYHELHALALVVTGLLTPADAPARLLDWATRAFGLGIVLFCGSLYLLAFGAPRVLGLLAPLGGLAFMAGWSLVAAHALRRPRPMG